MYEKLAKKYYGSYYISESLPSSRTSSLRKKRSTESAGQNGASSSEFPEEEAEPKKEQKIAAIRLCFMRHNLGLCYFP